MGKAVGRTKIGRIELKDSYSQPGETIKALLTILTSKLFTDMSKGKVNSM